MKVYVVTAGDYSDYHIVAIFTDEEAAWHCASKDSYAQIEEYETDVDEISGAVNPYILITYDFENNRINEVELCEKPVDGKIPVGCVPCLFEFTIENTMKTYREYTNEKDYSHTSGVLLKIAQDRFSEYASLKEKSREELIQKSHKACEAWKKRQDEKYRNIPYIFYTSSSTPPVDPVSESLNKWVASFQAENGRYPDAHELLNRKDELIAKAVKE